jgi:hypothetical protein
VPIRRVPHTIYGQAQRTRRLSALSLFPPIPPPTLSVRASGALNAQLLQTAGSVLKASGVIPAKYQRFTPAMIAVNKGSVMDALSEQKDAPVYTKRDANAASLEKASSVMRATAYPLVAHPIVSTLIPSARSLSNF